MSGSEFIYKNEIVDKYCEDLGSSIVSETGIPSDRYHLGKLILHNLKKDPDFVMQIDGGTGESETNASVLRRTVQCATSMKSIGLRTGDVMILMGSNHLDLAIPLYAALYLGVTVAAIDRTLGVYELKDIIKTTQPKIIFGENSNVLSVNETLKLLSHHATVINFDKNEHTFYFDEFLEKSGDVNVEDFKATDFDPAKTISVLISTSGTTGLPKSAAITHEGCVLNGRVVCTLGKEFPVPFRSVLIVSPLQWLSALVNFIFAPYFKYTRIQSSVPITPKLAFNIINKYKPEFIAISPTMMTTWLNNMDEENCDFSCFKVILMGGSAVPKDLVEKVKSLSPNAVVASAFGMSELCGPAFNCVDCPFGSLGKRYSHLQYKLVDNNTGEEITEPNRCGELWMKGDGIFKGYYNNEAATAAVFSKDGWFKTGDMMYRDEHWDFYFVERIKTLLKYKNHQVSPVELEGVIREHPGVSDVVVIGLPDPECGDLPAACVLPRPGVTISAQEIQDLVKEKLTETKHLRGGVYFVNEMPLTATTKVNRQKIKEIILEQAREESRK